MICCSRYAFLLSFLASMALPAVCAFQVISPANFQVQKCRSSAFAKHIRIPVVSHSPCFSNLKMIVDIGPAALLGTACLSIAAERNKYGSQVGSALISFCFMCILSNIGVIPSSHAAFDFCWSSLLPLSLATTVLACLSSEQSANNTSLSSWNRLGVPFAMGAAGSLLGALIAYYVSTGTNIPLSFRLSSNHAAAASAVLTATYIGGSANLYAVAAAIGIGHGEGGILSSIAAVDVFLMALYFVGLVTFQKSAFFHKVFGNHYSFSAAEVKVPKEEIENPNIYLFSPVALMLTLILAQISCFGGKIASKLLHFSSLQTAFITAISAISVALVKKWTSKNLHSRMRHMASSLSSLFLTLFFGAMGAQAHRKELIRGGPALLLFSAIVLTTHALCILLGSGFVNFVYKTQCISFDEVLVASNANVGGPSTAAAFSSTIRRPDLVLPATVWGTVGYGIATSLGLVIYSILSF